MKIFIKRIMLALWYIVISVILAFLWGKIFKVPLNESYIYTFLGVLAAEVASLKVNEKENNANIKKI